MYTVVLSCECECETHSNVIVYDLFNIGLPSVLHSLDDRIVRSASKNIVFRFVQRSTFIRPQGIYTWLIVCILRKRVVARFSNGQRTSSGNYHFFVYDFHKLP